MGNSARSSLTREAAAERGRCEWILEGLLNEGVTTDGVRRALKEIHDGAKAHQLDAQMEALVLEQARAVCADNPDLVPWDEMCTEGQGEVLRAMRQRPDSPAELWEMLSPRAGDYETPEWRFLPSDEREPWMKSFRAMKAVEESSHKATEVRSG